MARIHFSVTRYRTDAISILATVPGGGGREAITGQGVYETLKSRGILIRWWDLPRIADKVRITIGTPDQNDRLLTELKTLI